MAQGGKAAKITYLGPFFESGATGLFQKELTKGLVSLDEEFVGEVEKRFKPGKGYRTGALKGSFGEAKEVGKMTAGAPGTDPGTQDYYHRVEYGSRYMKGQNQRKNARKAILRAVKNPTSKRGQMIIKRAVERLNG